MTGQPNKRGIELSQENNYRPRQRRRRVTASQRAAEEASDRSDRENQTAEGPVPAGIAAGGDAPVPAWRQTFSHCLALGERSAVCR